MANYRADRMSEDIQREIAAILREMKDPRLHNGIISVVRCETAHDLSYSKVYISSMNGLDTAKQAVRALKNAQGFMDSIEYSANISRMLSQIQYTETTDEPAEEKEDADDEEV